MKIDVFTLFPDVFPAYLDSSILKRASESGLLEVGLHNIRDYALDKHSVTDDEPYGGGGGMVMKAEPLFRAVESVLGNPPKIPVILLSPQGRPFNQSIARELSKHDHFSLVCGRYEGVDERVRQHLVSDEISVGDYVLTGGELPALLIIDAVVRFLPGALGNPNGAENDSFANGLLEHPHYTRPQEFRDWEVPEVLRSGDHARIEQWRHLQSLLRTFERRPELLDMANLSDEEKDYLKSVGSRDET
jgi:tRNA (guanine37-N1)-methyltransferase